MSRGGGEFGQDDHQKNTQRRRHSENRLTQKKGIKSKKDEDIHKLNKVGVSKRTEQGDKPVPISGSDNMSGLDDGHSGAIEDKGGKSCYKEKRKGLEHKKERRQVSEKLPFQGRNEERKKGTTGRGERNKRKT